MVASVPGAADVQVEQTRGTLLKSLFVSGTKHYAGTPGFVRASLLHSTPAGETATQYVIEINLDDISGERIIYDSPEGHGEPPFVRGNPSSSRRTQGGP